MRQFFHFAAGQLALFDEPPGDGTDRNPNVGPTQILPHADPMPRKIGSSSSQSTAETGRAPNTRLSTKVGIGKSQIIRAGTERMDFL